jgi:hypothetical protein
VPDRANAFGDSGGEFEVRFGRVGPSGSTGSTRAARRGSVGSVRLRVGPSKSTGSFAGGGRRSAAGPGVIASKSCCRPSGGGGNAGALSRATGTVSLVIVGVGVNPPAGPTAPACVTVDVGAVGGGTVLLGRLGGIGGGAVAPALGGNEIPVGGPLLPALLGGSGGNRRPHA